MTDLLVVIQVILTLVLIYFIVVSNSNGKSKKVIINKENRKEMNILKRMREISLTKPLTEKSRPEEFKEIIGQERGIKALKAALCGENPQHVIIYGPPGVGKTAAARLVLKEAKKNTKSPFKKDAKFIEIDATTLHFDERGIADPLIGSVHDPIYQGAGALGIAGIPQPKPGAVTKAHGGILFIDEIGEMHPVELNKLLKVLEDRKVFLDSSYYSSEDPNMPDYIKDIFNNGLPADFRLIGATTKRPEEISPAIRSRCVEIFFRSLYPEEIIKIAVNTVKKIGLNIDENSKKIISNYCYNGREVINLIQLAAGNVLNEKRNIILKEDIEWVIENGRYVKRVDSVIKDNAEVGLVNGLAVSGLDEGMLLPIEVSAKLAKEPGKGKLKVAGIIEEESLDSDNRKLKRKGTTFSSIENVVAVLSNMFDIECDDYNIRINFPGGYPVDGPSAGIAIATGIYSAIKGIKVDNYTAMTGEIGIFGGVKAIGGVKAKIKGAIKAGAKKVIIPKDNWDESMNKMQDIKIFAVENIKEVFEILSFNKKENSINVEIMSARSNTEEK